MKNYIIISFLAGALLFSSCEKFLDIVPKTQIPEDEQFGAEAGFKDALIGVYINVKGGNTYGKELTFGAIEGLISSWDVTNNTEEQQLGLFNYTDSRVIDKFNVIFSSQYRSIAHINSLLSNLETKRSVLKTVGFYEVMKAECLALRALLHFDLMRLYGPMPGEPGQGNQLAYVTTFDKSINEHISYEAYKVKIFQDFQEAEVLIKPFDPLISYSMADVRNPNGYGSKYLPSDDFLSYRNMRMNYYAIKSLQARASLWYGDNAAAYAAAKEVVDAKNADGSLKFKLATGADYTATNYVLTNEHIFGLYTFDMAKKYTDFFGNGLYKKGSAVTTITNQLYGNTGTDHREASLWNLLTMSNGSRSNVIRKYFVTSDNVTVTNDYKQIPVIRTSELYLILAEAAPFSEGLIYFKTFRTSRNIASLTNPQDYPSLVAEVLKEYRKEFYGEGQAFYAYKRLNASKLQILFAPAAAVVNYVLPMPTVELIK